ncbi:MAG: efflux transporter outer membrane subunit [Candidatus Andeanibacterium colombiense]|uniref:Efflux transporter outer membrane subunit n=1 Tax=Candidatus Andeanibacterium colombiense TaxID=3121345 RepID=A0AAJ6BQY0_9SPHN|nr:MAG: efflux transporter outer membrane subunit [Sphingomonadaceae bacterium]
MLLLGTALAGCTALAPDMPAHAVPVPARWSDQGDAAATYDDAHYWDALGDPALSALVEQALAQNLDLAQSATRLVQAREQLVQARAGFLPTLNASAGGNQGFLDGAGDPNFNLGLDASWEADLFGRIGNSARAASFDYEAAGFSLADLRRSIAGQVATQVISARAAANQLAMARDTLRIQEDNLQIARWRNQAGLVSSLDVEQARTQRAQTAAAIPQIESNLAATSNAISTLVGETPGRVRELLARTQPIPVPPALARLSAPADLLRRRPDVRQAEATLASDTVRIGVARAQLYPLLRLTGSIGTNDIGPLNLFDLVTGTVTGAVTQLLFDGGRTQSQIRSARALADGSLANWRKSILTALEEVESAIAARRAADARLTEYLEAVDAANNAAILARSQYQAGLTDFQTLLTSESALLSARNSVISAEADRAATFVRLTQALGGGWSGDNPATLSDDRTAP